MKTPTAGTPRQVARVVLVDPTGAVLLLSARDPGDPGAGTFWFTPGGGAEPGESLADAARREVLEETGYALTDPGPVVWRRRTAFDFEDVHYDQQESYYVVFCARFAPAATAWTEVEARTMTGAAWWIPDDLARTSERVYPEGLAGLLAGWLRAGSAAGAGP